jgi:zinc transporter 1/2/3
MDSVDLAKVVSMVVLFVGTLILGLLPIWIIRRMRVKSGNHEMSRGTKNVLSGMLCFGGGVLMATALTHLLPELHEGFKELQTNGTIKSTLPMAEIVFSAGFFLVYLIEELVHVIIHRRSHRHAKPEVSIHQSVGISVVQPNELEDSESCNEKTICKSNCENGDSDSSIPSTISGSHQAIVDNVSITSKNRTASVVVHHHDHHHHVMGDGNRSLPSIQGLFIIIGLSMHEILEGVAIGLEQTDGDVWSLFAAVATHKFVITFCVGMDMASNGVKTSLQVFYMIVLSLVSSIGIKFIMLFISF